MRTSKLAVALVAGSPALAQSAAWAQCGGIGFTGATTCVSGYVCQKSSDYYSQCVPGTAQAASSTTTTLRTTTKAATSTSAPANQATSPASTPGKNDLWWFGINLSGAEFGEGTIPGTYGKEYIWYSKSAIDTLLAKGMTMFRINFLMERLTPNGLTGALDSAYAGNLTETINYITGKGAYAMVQPHNYGRFNHNIITDSAGFKTWWKNVASLYKDNNLVVFDTNNEYHDMDQQLVFDLNQAAINGIREAGATTQYITPEGNAWSGAWSWVSSGNGASLVKLTDPADSTGNKLIFQMHQYLDSDSSGTNSACVSSTIFQERLVAATTWLRENGKRGLIGEYAGGANAQCISALQGGLKYLKENNDVWTGHLWWAAGPWWGDYMYNMEPPSGIAYTSVLPSLLDYA